MRRTKVFVMYLVYGLFCVQSVADSVDRNKAISLLMTVGGGDGEQLYNMGLTTVLNSLRVSRDILGEADKAMRGRDTNVTNRNDFEALLKIIEAQGAVLRAITAVEKAQESLHEAYEFIRPPRIKYN